MDIVYLCRRGANEELRYSLRSLTNVPHDKVWMFGGHPDWVSNVTVVATPQRGVKYAITSNSLRAACLHPHVSDPFWLWNDDFYATAPAEPKHYNRGPVRDVLKVYEQAHPTSVYTRGMRDTLDTLEAHGHYDPLSYELHAPLVVHKAAMLEALDLGQGHTCWHKRTAYGNLAQLGGTTTTDVKVYDSSRIPDAGPWLSSGDRTFGLVKRRLHALFPDPCWYEG